MKKIAHSPEVLCGETPQRRLVPGDKRRESKDRSFAPTIVLDPLMQMFTYVPVKIDQFRIHGLQGTPACAPNEFDYFGE